MSTQGYEKKLIKIGKNVELAGMTKEENLNFLYGLSLKTVLLGQMTNVEIKTLKSELRCDHLCKMDFGSDPKTMNHNYNPVLSLLGTLGGTFELFFGLSFFDSGCMLLDTIFQKWAA